MNPERVKASYLRAMTDLVIVRRYAGTGTGRPHFDVTAKARVMGDSSQELVGTKLLEGDRKVILYADDLIGKMSLPLTADDKIVVRGKEMAIISPPDDSTRSINGVLVAYELQIRGS